MNIIEIGLIVSAFVTFFLFLLFHFEMQRGERLFEHMRTRLDFAVLDLIHRVHTTAQLFFRRILIQSAYFIFHSILKNILSIAKAFERNITHMMHTNKARSPEVVNKDSTRNKLKEIALHKLEVSLTDEEKQIHKDNALNE